MSPPKPKSFEQAAEQAGKPIVLGNQNNVASLLLNEVANDGVKGSFCLSHILYFERMNCMEIFASLGDQGRSLP